MRWLGIGTLAVFAGWSAPVSATPVTFSGASNNKIVLQSGTHADWTITNTAGTHDGTPSGVCDSSVAGLGLYDARLEPGGVNKGDAVDNGFTVWVNDAQFVSPDTVDVVDETLTSGPVTMSGLDVTVEYKALPSTPTFRARVTLHNPSDAPIVVSFRLATNFGSDDQTGERASGISGNWRVTSDDPTSPDDPVLVTVGRGPNDRASFSGVPTVSLTDTTFSCTGAEGSELHTDLTVPAGETVYLMQFLELAATVTDATAAAAAFDVTPPADAEDTADLSAAETDATVNWGFFGDRLLVAGDATWVVSAFTATSNRQGSGGSCVGVPGIGLNDAQLTDPLQQDAFDGGQVLFVGGQQLVPPIAEQHTDQSVVFGPQTLAGLDVMLSYVAFSDSALLRTLVTLKNSGSAPISTTVQMASNFGSDDKTVVLASSNGNTTIETGDRWVVTADDPNTPTDAVNTSVVAGVGTPPVLPDLSSTAFDCTQTNGLLSAFALTLGAGETQVLMFFNQLSHTNDGAVSTATSFDSPASPLDPVLSDIDPATFARIVNFETCRAPDYPDASCRLDGLESDLTDVGTPGKALDQLRLRLTTVKHALDKALAAARLAKQGPVHRALKAASGALKAYEHLLKTKKVKAALPDDARTRFAATSKAFRAQIKLLPTRVLD